MANFANQPTQSGLVIRQFVPTVGQLWPRGNKTTT